MSHDEGTPGNPVRVTGPRIMRALARPAFGRFPWFTPEQAKAAGSED